jgi:hypothetical protein
MRNKQINNTKQIRKKIRVFLVRCHQSIQWSTKENNHTHCLRVNRFKVMLLIQLWITKAIKFLSEKHLTLAKMLKWQIAVKLRVKAT